MSKQVADAIPIEDVDELTIEPKKPKREIVEEEVKPKKKVQKKKKIVEYDYEEEEEIKPKKQKKRVCAPESDYEEEEEVKPKKKKRRTKKNYMTKDEFDTAINEVKRMYMRDALDDLASLSDCRSTSSTHTTPSMREDDDYLTKGQRLFIINQFTIPMIQQMRTSRGKRASGSTKRELVATAVNLVKTKEDIVDFILSAYD